MKTEIKKTSDIDKQIELASKYSSYVNKTDKVIGVYSTTEDSLIANKNPAIKRLTKKYGFKIQMLIK